MDRRMLWIGFIGLGVIAASSCGGELKLPDKPGASSSSGGPGGAGGEGGVGGMADGGGGIGGMGGMGGMMEPPPGKELFADGQIIGINIRLSAADLDALSKNPSVYVRGDVDVTTKNTMVTIPDTGVRIKGKIGSLRTLDQKAAFLLKFNEYTKGQKLDGLTKLAVNNMVQDASMIHERIGYILFNDMDVPSARSGYARVSVNGELFGLYATVETTSNGEFLNNWFGGDTGNLYEGAYGVDLDWGNYQGFDQDNGMFVSYTDIADLITALDAMTPQNFMVEASKVIDMDRYVKFAATEIYLGHWDGYASYQNNYYIYRRPDNNLWTFMPWGIDQTFSDHMDPFIAGSRVQQLCVQSIDCRKKLGAAYATILAKVDSLGLVAKCTEVKNLIWPDVLADPRREYGSDQVGWSIDDTINFLLNRKTTLTDGLQCVDPTGIDMDMDGTPGCGIDCDDNNPNVYPGAPEKCNFIDDDCSGVLDDNPACPKCLIEAAQGGGKYAYCVDTLSWAGAEADCKSQGGHLVSIHSSTEFQTIANRAQSLNLGDFWLGLNDNQIEGKFVWTDNTPVNFTFWNGGEPNDWGGAEDCAHVYASNNTWNDLDCNAGLRYVCKLP